LAQPKLFPQALSDPKFLSNLTWKSDKGIEALVKDWPPYTEDQGFDDKTVLSSTEITILGTTFAAEYRVFKEDSLSEIVLVDKSAFSEKFCPSFIDWVTERLGKPNKVLDRSIFGKTNSLNDFAADWLLGQTRVQLNCFGTTRDGKYISGSAILAYRHKDRLKALEDLIYIECSSTIRYTGSLFAGRPTEDGAPLTLIIDPNSERLLRRDKSSFLETTKYTDEAILASEENEKGKQDFQLDRVTGNYQLNLRLKRYPGTAMTQWGKCTRIDAAKRF